MTRSRRATAPQDATFSRQVFVLKEQFLIDQADNIGQPADPERIPFPQSGRSLVFDNILITSRHDTATQNDTAVTGSYKNQ
jgi:hypothetical protein